MVTTKSELANRTLAEMQTYEHTKILKIYKGKAAVDGIKKLWLEANLFSKESQANTWAKKWNNYDKSQSLLIITESRLPKRKFRPVIGYSFEIGDLETGSSLGSHWPTYEEGVTTLEKLKLL
jgi:hypothetical protein